MGAVIQYNLSPEKHIDKIFNNTFKMVGNIQMAIHFLDKDMMGKIITSMIRPKLKYVEVMWFPHKKKYLLKLERIQKVTTKIVHN